MSANTHLSAAGCQLALNALLDVLNGTGTVQVYTGTQPASCDVAVGVQVLLATLALSATAFAAAASASPGATKTANAITSATAVAGGTATWFRAFKSDGTTAVIDGSCGTATADMILSSTTITTNDTVTCTSWVASMAK